MNKPDPQIQQELLRELAADGRCKPTDVGVTVRNGVVTLVGQVDSWEKSRAAVEAAHRLVGVRDVVNELDVCAIDSGRVSDRTIATAVRESLRERLGAAADAVISTVSHGVVVLDGVVDRECLRQEIDSAARDVRGARDVIDCVHVRAEINGDELRAAIESALKAHCARQVARLELRIVDGRVEILGHVESEDEKHRIVDAVRCVSGVRSCADHTVVVPGEDRPPAF